MAVGRFNRDSRGGGFQPRGRSFGGGGRNFDRGGDRPMYKAICDNCGKECEVPFRPTSGKPVYCSDCFEKIGPRREDLGRPVRSDFRKEAPSSDQNKAQLDAINTKLDKILGILQPKIATPEVSTLVVKAIKEEKAPKAKKAAKKSSTKKE